jgi:hypothetical protein
MGAHAVSWQAPSAPQQRPPPPAQIGDPKAAASALASPRACARAFPTAEVGGLLFAWLESGPAAEAEAAAAPPPAVAGGNEGAEWSASLAPNDARFWLEQGVDPSHAPLWVAGPGEVGAITHLQLALAWFWPNQQHLC